MLSIVIGIMALCSTVFSGSFLLLSFLSKVHKKVFVTFSILFGFSAWGLFEYAIYLAGSDLFYLIFYPSILVPILPFFFSSIALFLFLLYCLIREFRPKK
ncbi:MAG: hypothetical protein QXQ77_03085 [Candidatus Aenigmatarchaeota archaeon]